MIWKTLLNTRHLWNSDSSKIQIILTRGSKKLKISYTVEVANRELWWRLYLFFTWLFEILIISIWSPLLLLWSWNSLVFSLISLKPIYSFRACSLVDQNFARNFYMWRREKHLVVGRPNLQWQRDTHLHAKIPEGIKTPSEVLVTTPSGLTQYFVLQATFSFQSLSLVHAWLSFILAAYELLFLAHLFSALPCMSKILKFLFVL